MPQYDPLRDGHPKESAMAQQRRTTDDGAARRTAFAKALAAALADELKTGIDAKLLAASDRVLMQLWARGYMIAPVSEESSS